MKDGDPSKGETGTSAPLVVKDKVLVGISGGEFGIRGRMTAYNIKDGSLAWKGYSSGPDSDILVDPQKTTDMGKPIGADSSVKTWQGQQWMNGGGRHMGLDLVRSSTEPGVLRIGQPRHLEPDSAAGVTTNIP